MRRHALTPGDYLELKRAFEKVVSGCAGIVAAAAATRVGPSQIAAYYDEHRPHRMPPVDVVADLERCSGLHLVTAELARIAGYALIPLTPADGTQLAAAIAECARDAAEVPATYLEVAADGHVTREEAARVQREALEAVSSLTHVAIVAGALAQGAAPSSPAAPAVEGEKAPAVGRATSARHGGPPARASA